MPNNTHVVAGMTENAADAVDKLLSKELLKMSASDRNDLQEEIHGVKCLALQETPHFLEQSLNNMAYELDEVLPVTEKQGYIMSQKKAASKEYVNSREFRLRILRCELFNVRKAAERLAIVCDCLLHLFGPYALERPVRISDFTSEELKSMRKGRLQPFPFRDQSGRRVMVIFPGAELINETECKENEDNTSNRRRIRALQMKIFLYFSFVMSEDVETQRRGVVGIVWIDPALQSKAISDVSRIQKSLKSHKASVTRVSAFHVCSPDTPTFRMIRSVLLLGVGRHRSWLRVHLGEPVELRYKLKCYGISADTIPISCTGTVKTTYMKQWMTIRKILENPDLRGDSVQLPIESPRLDDIIFKKGTSAVHHPGNACFRSLIQRAYEDEPLLTRERLVGRFLQDIQMGKFRVLIWNENYSYWCILNDHKQVRQRLDKAIRNFAQDKSLRYRNIQTLQSSTVIFRGQQQEDRIECKKVRCSPRKKASASQIDHFNTSSVDEENSGDSE